MSISKGGKRLERLGNIKIIFRLGELWKVIFIGCKFGVVRNLVVSGLILCVDLGKIL